MTAAALVDHLAGRGVTIASVGGKLRIEAPTGVVTSADRRLLSEHKGAIIGLLTPLEPVPVAALDDPALFEARKRSVGIDIEAAHERFQERAAIMEYDGGLDRPEAERLALAEIIGEIGGNTQE